MLGSAIADAWRRLRPADDIVAIGRGDVDLRDRRAVAEMIDAEAPDAVIHAAARVGGIAAKLAHPTEYLLDNMLIDSSVIGGAREAGVAELLYIGSSAIYPEQADQPIRPDALLTGRLESANEGYALAKIAGSRLCRFVSDEDGLAYRTAVPSNLYGPGDDFRPGRAHLIAAALGKARAAKNEGADHVSVWGDGTARREFTYSVDLAEWMVSQVGALAAWPDLLHLGCGVDYSIAEYYRVALDVVGVDAELRFEPDRPSGAARRLLDSAPARELGWAPPTPIRDGMAAVDAAHQSAERERVTG